MGHKGLGDAYGAPGAAYVLLYPSEKSPEGSGKT